MPSRLRKINISKDLKLKYLLNERYIADDTLINNYYDFKDLNNLIETINKIKMENNFIKINLEIGCGVGDYIKEMSKIKKNELFIGLDYDIQVIFRAIKNLYDFGNEGISNIKFIALDALNLLDEEKVYKKFDRIIIPFPDPWPKKRHKKRRFIKLENIKKLQNLIKEKGQLIIITDNNDYALNIENDLISLKNQNMLDLKSLFNKHFYTNDRKIFEKYYPFVETRYYKKALLKGNDIFFFVLKKVK